MRELLEREASDSACRLAVAMYVYSVKKAVGSFAAALGGLDILVFAGGIGEHAPAMRASICNGLEFLGVELRPGKQRRQRSDDIVRQRARRDMGHSDE